MVIQDVPGQLVEFMIARGLSGPVYGKIRYMNRNGAKNKFDIESSIRKYNKKKLI